MVVVSFAANKPRAFKSTFQTATELAPWIELVAGRALKAGSPAEARPFKGEVTGE